MAKNLGLWDRIIRAVVGAVLLGMGFWRQSVIDFVILGCLGLLILATAVAGRDPLYRVYGITTRGGLHRLPCGEHGESCRPEFHQY